MKQVNGFWWPDHDEQCHRAVKQQLPDVEVALKYVDTRGVCVQAGGNVGVWASKLAETFGVVYTAEPDPENFNCLSRNVQKHNVVKLNAAFGEKHEMIRVGMPQGHGDTNCGAYQVLGDGYIPTLCIDDLNLPDCDLIYLDIEGYEKAALKGAEDTIAKYSPVIALEQKPLPIMYDDDPMAASNYLIEKHGYKIVEKIHRDVILIKE